MYTGSPWRPVTTQAVTVSGTSAAVTNAFGAGIQVVRLAAEADCYIAFGAAPTATTSDLLLKAAFPEYFVVSPGEKVAAIQHTSGGDLTVTEMSR